MSYFNEYDDPHGERRSIIPFLSLKEKLALSVMRARDDDARLAAQAEKLLADEAAHEAQQQDKLDTALEVISELLEDGKQGLDPGKVMAVAEFIKRGCE